MAHPLESADNVQLDRVVLATPDLLEKELVHRQVRIREVKVDLLSNGVWVVALLFHGQNRLDSTVIELSTTPSASTTTVTGRDLSRKIGHNKDNGNDVQSQKL